MRTALIISGLLSALATFGITAALLSATSGIASAVLTGQFLTSFGVTAFCFFGASVLGHLERQRAAQIRTNELLAAVRDALVPPAPEPAPVVEPARPAAHVERVEPRFGAD